MIWRGLSDAQWRRIKKGLPGKNGDRGRSGADNRLFVDAVLWVLRTGSPWRDLPEEFGNWNSVFQRFRRWAMKGVWESVFNALVEDPDFEYLMIDATIVRAHQHAAGANSAAIRRRDTNGACRLAKSTASNAFARHWFKTPISPSAT